jgi:glutamate dehydrogenase (NAD(P)+)
MRKGVTLEEVTYLAKSMQLKFAYSGPPIGGGKSGIAFDPKDPRKDDVLRRWFAAVRPFLRTRYGTGGDVNVDEQRDVVRLCAEIGIVHPQEGVVRGHLGVRGSGVERTFTSLADGICQSAGPSFGVDGLDLTVSDLVTGYGVARATERLADHRGETLEGTRVIVEGFGNVGRGAALYLSRMGARIVGIIDAEAGLASPEGLRAAEVEDLLRRQNGRALPGHPGRVTGPEREIVYREAADLFIPAAISGLVDARRLAQLARHGVRCIVCGANQPFREVRRGDTETIQAADGEFEVLPEVVASLGMARAFYHLMANPDARGVEEIFGAVATAADEAVALSRAVHRERGGCRPAPWPGAIPDPR